MCNVFLLLHQRHFHYKHSLKLALFTSILPSCQISSFISKVSLFNNSQAHSFTIIFLLISRPLFSSAGHFHMNVFLRLELHKSKSHLVFTCKPSASVSFASACGPTAFLVIQIQKSFSFTFIPSFQILLFYLIRDTKNPFHPFHIHALIAHGFLQLLSLFLKHPL